MALLPLAALAVHQLRYALAFGAEAPQRLADQGHAYLGSVEALAVVLCAVAGGGFLTRLAGAWCGRAEPGSRRLGLVRLWLVSAVALTTVYAGQELLEGFLVAGHPPGVEGVLGHGGWLALPLSLAIGGVVALLLRGAQAVLAYVRRVAALRRAPQAPAPGARVRPAAVVLRRRDPLAGAAAGRAPPVRALAHA
jgi:hypothetical protein